MEKRLILSTVGTSILTNVERAIPPREKRPVGYSLYSLANLRESELDPPKRAWIDEVAKQAKNRLDSASPETAKTLSAELNGIISYYGDAFLDRRRLVADQHVLLATDTYQGQVCAELVASWLLSQGIAQCRIQTVQGLSTRNEESFRQGIDSLLRWASEELPTYRDQRGSHVVFNLVGSFKSLQGYMVALGMLYADEIIYIFEGEGSSLIRIPRLPVTLTELETIRAHAATLALLEANEVVRRSRVKNLPEALLTFDEEGFCTFSSWGATIWERNRTEILGSAGLLDFPKLEYSSRFRKEFEALGGKETKAKVLQTLARVSVILGHGGRERLREHGGLQYESLNGHPGVDHFRVDESMRITCEAVRGGLRLRRVGGHEILLHP